MKRLFILGSCLFLFLTTSEGDLLKAEMSLEKPVKKDKYAIRKARLDSVINHNHLKDGFVVFDDAGEAVASGELNEGVSSVVKSLDPGNFHIYLQSTGRVFELMKTF